MSIAGKCAVVTGSNSGIGLGIAEEMAKLGADVVVNSFTDRPEDQALAERIAGEHGVRCVYVQADMSKGDECRDLIAKAKDAMGHVDILVNNAGIQFVAPIPEFPVEKWDQIIAINLVLGVPHHRRRAADHAGAGLGADRQYRLGARAARLAVQGGLCRGQARSGRVQPR